MLAICGRIYNCDYFVEFLYYYLLFTTRYYLYDSNRHDERGLSMVDGTSVLMKFRDLYELEKYLQVAYLEYRARQQAYFY